MRNIALVVRHDVSRALRQRSFWVISLLLPILLVGMNAFNLIRANREEGGGNGQAATEAVPVRAVGLVDASGIITTIPAALPAELFQRYGDETAARAALEAGQIEQYVYIPADYLNSGQVLVYDENFQLLSGGDSGMAMGGTETWVLDYLAAYNLTGSDQVSAALRNPTPGWLAEVHLTQPPVQGSGGDQGLGSLVASIMPMIYYVLLLTGSSYLMQSVVSEKENRTAEVLLLSLDPRELMVGKLLAGTTVLLVQLVIWVGGGFLAMDRGEALLQAAQYDFPPGFVAWASLFLLAGYLLYASIMGAVGALAPSFREGAQMTWVLVVPFLPTLMFAQLFLEEPGHPLVIGLSLFPFSAPGAMVTRLAVGQVPTWQLLLSLAALAATAYLFVVLSARFFRAGNLLSDAAFNWRRLATGWRKE